MVMTAHSRQERFILTITWSCISLHDFCNAWLCRDRCGLCIGSALNTSLDSGYLIRYMWWPIPLLCGGFAAWASWRLTRQPQKHAWSVGDHKVQTNVMINSSAWLYRIRTYSHFPFFVELTYKRRREGWSVGRPSWSLGLGVISYCKVHLSIATFIISNVNFLSVSILSHKTEHLKQTDIDLNLFNVWLKLRRGIGLTFF